MSNYRKIWNKQPAPGAFVAAQEPVPGARQPEQESCDHVYDRSTAGGYLVRRCIYCPKVMH